MKDASGSLPRQPNLGCTARLGRCLTWYDRAWERCSDHRWSSSNLHHNSPHMATLQEAHDWSCLLLFPPSMPLSLLSVRPSKTLHCNLKDCSYRMLVRGVTREDPSLRTRIVAWKIEQVLSTRCRRIRVEETTGASNLNQQCEGTQ